MQTLHFKRLALASAMAGIFLTGCGGGGGSGGSGLSSSLSGTVSGGAAVIGTVLVTDSLGASKGAAIEADGHYAVDVTGMTGPFILKANGTVGNTAVTYYSAAVGADVGNTVNVTPFTDMMVSNIAAQMASTYFANPANTAHIGALITPASLAAAQTALHAKLQPLLATLGMADSIDLLRSAFATNHSGMDALIDLVKVEADPATNITTLKNALTQQVIATDNATLKTDDATVVDGTRLAGITPTAVSDLQAVVNRLNAFGALFASGLPNVATLQNSGVFDTSANFQMGGQTFAQFASELSTQPKAVGLKFSNVAMTLDASGLTSTLTALISSNTASFGDLINLNMSKVNGVWLVVGDGRMADVSLSAQAQRDEWTNTAPITLVQSSGTFTSSGIYINVDPQSYNTNHPGALAVSATVTGPGLPVGGVNLVQSVQNTWFNVDLPNYPNNVIPECGSSVNGTQGPFVVTTQCVTVAQALDSSSYTVVIKNAAGASLNGAGYPLTLPKQPFSTAALTPAMFPAFTSITVDGTALTPALLLANKSVAVSWALPAGLLSRNINAWANTSGGASYFNVSQSLAPAATSALLALGTPNTTGTATNAGVWLVGQDVFGRRLAVSKSMQTP